ncbi:MAG TPA: GNAT family protein [Flavisolibacter sp.]|nr:GNAT family protein [Flavisolibacter sp.]
MPALSIDTSKLKGAHVYLEHLRPDHTDVLRSLARDERLWEFTKTLLINDTYDEQFTSYITTALDPAAIGGQQAFVIRATADDAILGMTRFYFIEPKDKRLAIGYTWYIPAVWGGPHNKECKLLLLQYAFETLGFNRVEFHVAHQNIRSQKAVEKIGAVKEGVLRKYALRPDGSIRDTVVFSIIDEEWAEKKQRLQEMLKAY